jgi:hypothetical protein
MGRRGKMRLISGHAYSELGRRPELVDDRAAIGIAGRYDLLLVLSADAGDHLLVGREANAAGTPVDVAGRAAAGRGNAASIGKLDKDLFRFRRRKTSVCMLRYVFDEHGAAYRFTRKPDRSPTHPNDRLNLQ